MAMKHLTEEPPALRNLNPSVPKTLEALTLGLLAKDPKERCAPTEELVYDRRRMHDGGRPLFVGAGPSTLGAGPGGSPRPHGAQSGGGGA